MATVDVVPGYEPLLAVLVEALDRSQKGKGVERHGNGLTFFEQPIIQIPKNLGGSSTPLLFQAVKKIYESQRLEHAACQNELLDAIVYIAAAVLLDRTV